ncbi:hypothetical protein [Neisseria sp. P0008.S004]|uniref:hypothetical protein n=1 Tax=Neisseria sp. P0008.S004 TaxID=3436701 RepID=UPI003F7EFE70
MNIAIYKTKEIDHYKKDKDTNILFNASYSSSNKNSYFGKFSSKFPLSEIINSEFEKGIKEKFEPEFLNFILNFEVLLDRDSYIEKRLFSFFDENQHVTSHWFSDIYYQYADKSFVLVNLLKIIAKIHDIKSCETISKFRMFVLAALGHKDIEVKDFALQVFELWNDKSVLKVLENIPPLVPEWLENYRQTIISELMSR